MIEIHPVESRADRKQFVRFPRALYRGDASWSEPLELERLAFIDPKKQPFLRHGSAQPLLALQDGKPVGRVLVSDDPRSNARYDESICCFGLFECIEQQEVADALFQAAADWAIRRGRSFLRGPIDYSTNYAVGLLIEGYDLPQRIWMNHHPFYYRRLIERCGFRKELDILSWAGHERAPILEMRARLEKLHVSSDISIREFSESNRPRDEAIVEKLFDRVFQDQWGYVPMTSVELHEFKKLLRWVPNDLVLIAEDQGEPVGFCLGIPNYNEAIHRARGRLFWYGLPVGLIRLAWGLRRIRCIRLALLGVDAAYRQQGIAERMIFRVWENAVIKRGYSEAELGWTLEDNRSIISISEALAGPGRRRFRIFKRAVVT